MISHVTTDLGDRGTPEILKPAQVVPANSFEIRGESGDRFIPWRGSSSPDFWDGASGLLLRTLSFGIPTLLGATRPRCIAAMLVGAFAGAISGLARVPDPTSNAPVPQWKKNVALFSGSLLGSAVGYGLWRFGHTTGLLGAAGVACLAALGSGIESRHEFKQRHRSKS